MSGHRIVVTGAASGIGLALAERLVTAGFQVVGIDRGECPEWIVDAHRIDLGDTDAVRTAANSVEGPLHGIANVAGVPGSAPAETVLAVNLVGARVLTEALLPKVVEGGAVVNVASVAAHRNTLDQTALAELLKVDHIADIAGWLTHHPLTGPEAYDTSKAAMLQWTGELAARLLARHVRAVSVSPGPVDTPILADFRATMGADRLDRSAALVGRHGKADEVAAVAAFLLGPDASWVNGIDIPVEGGLFAARQHLP